MQPPSDTAPTRKKVKNSFFILTPRVIYYPLFPTWIPACAGMTVTREWIPAPVSLYGAGCAGMTGGYTHLVLLLKLLAEPEVDIFSVFHPLLTSPIEGEE